MNNKFQQQLDSHKIHSVLKNFENVLIKAREHNQSDELTKIHKCHAWIVESLARVDADLFPIEHLNTLQTHISHSSSEVTNFVANKNVVHLTGAVNHINNAINLLPNLSVAFLKEKTKQNLNLSKAMLDSFTNELNEIKSKTSALDKNISTMQSTADEIKLNVNETKKQNAETVSILQQQFLTSQAENLKSFKNTLDGYKKEHLDELSSLKEEHTKSLTATLDKFEKEMSRLLDDSKSKNKTITDLYNIATVNSISGSYAKTSEDECNTADSLRLSGIMFFCVGAVWVIFCLVVSALEQPTFGMYLSIEHMIPMTTITIIIISLGAYLVHQSEKHRKTSRWANQLHLELTAFEPFIHSLSKDKQEELRKNITEKLFGQVKNPQDSYDKVSSGHLSEVIPGLLDKSIELVKSIKTP